MFALYCICEDNFLKWFYQQVVTQYVFWDGTMYVKGHDLTYANYNLWRAAKLISNTNHQKLKIKKIYNMHIIIKSDKIRWQQRVVKKKQLKRSFLLPTKQPWRCPTEPNAGLFSSHLEPLSNLTYHVDIIIYRKLWSQILYGPH